MIEAAPSFGLQALRERTEKGLQPRLWEMRAVLAMLDDYRAGADEEARAGDEARAKVRDLTEQAARDKVLNADLARHNVNLTSELQDAEQRAREAEGKLSRAQQEWDGWDEQAQRMSDKIQRLRHENGVLRSILAMSGPCIHQALVDAEKAHAEGHTISLEQYMESRGIAEAGTGEKTSGRKCTCGRKDFCTSWCGTELPNEAGTAGGEGSK